MNRTELATTLLLAAVLVGLAVYFGYRQFLTLRGVATPDMLGADDRRFLRSQAYRRLFCSFLMVVFAGMLIGWIFLDPALRQLHEEQIMQAGEEAPAVWTDDQRQSFQLFSMYWISALLVVLVLMLMAALDFWSTTRYGLAQHRRLKADHREFVEEQIARRRRERNGQH